MNSLEAATDLGSSPRLRFRLCSPEELETPVSWYATDLATDWSWRELESQARAGQVVCATAVESDDLVGLAAFTLDTPVSGDATITLLTVDPKRRFRGLGGEVGLFLEGYLRDEVGAHRVLAPVPEGRGLAVYFWLRLGFRPQMASASGYLLPEASGFSPGLYMLRQMG